MGWALADKSGPQLARWQETLEHDALHRGHRLALTGRCRLSMPKLVKNGTA